MGGGGGGGQGPGGEGCCLCLCCYVQTHLVLAYVLMSEVWGGVCVHQCVSMRCVCGYILVGLGDHCSSHLLSYYKVPGTVQVFFFSFFNPHNNPVREGF